MNLKKCTDGKNESAMTAPKPEFARVGSVKDYYFVTFQHPTGAGVSFGNWKEKEDAERLCDFINAAVAPIQAKAGHFDTLNKDKVEDEEAIKKLCRPILGDTDVDGTSYDVPSCVDCVELAIQKLQAKADLTKKMREGIRWMAQTIHQAYHETGTYATCTKSTCAHATELIAEYDRLTKPDAKERMKGEK